MINKACGISTVMDRLFNASETFHDLLSQRWSQGQEENICLPSYSVHVCYYLFWNVLPSQAAAAAQSKVYRVTWSHQLVAEQISGSCQDGNSSHHCKECNNSRFLRITIIIPFVWKRLSGTQGHRTKVKSTWLLKTRNIKGIKVCLVT